MENRIHPPVVTHVTVTDIKPKNTFQNLLLRHQRFTFYSFPAPTLSYTVNTTYETIFQKLH